MMKLYRPTSALRSKSAHRPVIGSACRAETLSPVAAADAAADIAVAVAAAGDRHRGFLPFNIF